MLLTDYKSYQLPSLLQPDQRLPLTVRRLGLQDYSPIWHTMQYIASNPQISRNDEIWLLSHKPVFTLGQAGKPEHVLNKGKIPLLQTDRGGQVTYHGPGQLVVYLLIDVRKRKLGIRNLVDLIEVGTIEALAEFGVTATSRKDAPGVYVDDAKIAALGLRIRNGRSYHGLSLNVDMDMSPFDSINPCGFEGLRVTQLADLVPDPADLLLRVSTVMANSLLRQLGHQEIN